MEISNVLYTLALGLFAGLFLSRIIKPLKMPAVTGYLIAGLLIGPYCLGALGITGMFSEMEQVDAFSPLIKETALGFIAFAIGTEFELSSLKRIGKQATVVGCVQALVAMLFVDVALIGLHFVLGEDKLPLSVAVTLGAIATATAPAATLMVVKQYKAKGPVTDILLPVVALDDAVGLACFAIFIGVAQAIEGGSMTLVNVLLNPLLEVFLSLVLGAAVGLVFSFVEKMFLSNSKRLCVSITFVLLGIAASKMEFTFDNGVKIAFSSLLVCMMLGTLFCNVCKHADELMAKTDKWTMPLLVLFFVTSGAELELSVFKNPTALLIGVVYILFRCLGKYFGASWSAKATKCSPTVVKYLGITLFPQAGVALGMCYTASQVLGAENGALVRNIVLFSVLIYELVGPMLTKLALTKAGDIIPKPPKKETLAEAFADEIDEDDLK